jgi:hypothetical protein
MDYIPGGADDLSYLLKKVTFRLHETYPNPSRGQSPAIPSLGSMNPADIV